MDDTTTKNDTDDGIQVSVQCVDNPVGKGVMVYEEKSFYHTPVPQVPVQCVDSSEGPIVIYYGKTFYRSPQSQDYEEDDHMPISSTVPFFE